MLMRNRVEKTGESILPLPAKAAAHTIGILVGILLIQAVTLAGLLDLLALAAILPLRRALQVQGIISVAIRRISL